MIFNKPLFKGILYNSKLLYKFQTVIKLGKNKNLRFEIAARHISPGDSVLDVASGGGWLKKYIPSSCSYTCVEAGDAFVKELVDGDIKYIKMNLHEGISGIKDRYDKIVMLISLYQFRNTSMEKLLEQFKKIGKKVVIVEEVSLTENLNITLKDKLLNYLCYTDYYIPTKILTSDEFIDVCKRHDYDVSFDSTRDKYMIATYSKNVSRGD